MVALRRVALGLATVCFVLRTLWTGAGAATPCDSEEAAARASSQRLQAMGTRSSDFNRAMDDFNRTNYQWQKCIDQWRKKEQEAKDAARAAKRQAIANQTAAWHDQILREVQSFVDAVRVGMTAAEVDPAERDAFHNPTGWGKRLTLPSPRMAQHSNGCIGFPYITGLMTCMCTSAMTWYLLFRNNKWLAPLASPE